MALEFPERPEPIDALREVPETVTLDWLLEHANMEPALRAYKAGVKMYGPSRPDTLSPEGQEKLRLVWEKVRIDHVHQAIFTLPHHEMHEALCFLPLPWLQHAKLKRIVIKPPAYFCFGEMENHPGHYRICHAIDRDDADDHFRGKEVNVLREQNIIGPPTPFHYAPGMYVPTDETIILWQEPADVMALIGSEARREYGRELIVHEALHSVFEDGSLLLFFIDGRWQDYRSLMEQFHAICQEEPVSATHYAELYAPWRTLPLSTESGQHWTTDWRIRAFLQEELGELLSAQLRGWGASPVRGGRSEPKRPSGRDFGGAAFHETGVSRKVAFVDALLRAPVRLCCEEAPAQESAAFRGRHRVGE